MEIIDKISDIPDISKTITNADYTQVIEILNTLLISFNLLNNQIFIILIIIVSFGFFYILYKILSYFL